MCRVEPTFDAAGRSRLLTCGGAMSLEAVEGGSPVGALLSGPWLIWSGLALLPSLSIEFTLPVGVDLCIVPFSSLATLARASGLFMEPWEPFIPSRPPARALSWCFFDLKRKAMADGCDMGRDHQFSMMRRDKCSQGRQQSRQRSSDPAIDDGRPG